MKVTNALIALMLLGTVAVFAVPEASAWYCLPGRDDPECLPIVGDELSALKRNVEDRVDRLERGIEDTWIACDGVYFTVGYVKEHPEVLLRCLP